MATKPKRRKSVAGAAAAEEPKASSPGPVTRSQTSTARGAAAAAAATEVLGALGFLQDKEFQEAKHVPALYRLAPGPGRAVSAVREPGVEKGADFVADVLRLPSPYVAVDLADKCGVWQSQPPALKQLGEDPSEQLRELHAVAGGSRRSTLSPAGLKNLGATCYLNSLLQYLFFNTDFRRSLLQAKSQSEVVRALQRVFALMAAGDRSVVDPSEFVRVAGVETGEQEDATEFSTLLLDWLERELGKGQEAQGGGGGFISELFQGEVSHLLTCFADPSHRFERREPFFELRARLSLPAESKPKGARPAGEEAQPEGPGAAVSRPPEATVIAPPDASPAAPKAPSAQTPSGKRASGGKKKAPPPTVRLEELLTSTAFPDEMLDGSNQYHCPTCDCKVDARASIRLARPPPYLHITLERHHYDLQKGERKKLNNPVSFPVSLRLRLSRVKPGEAAEADTGSASGAAGSAAGSGDGGGGGGGGEGGGCSEVSYECVGYLEHVSESAIEGHYTATLYQDDDSAAEALAQAASLEAGAKGAAGASGDAGEAEEPAAKRRCCDGADAAAGVPRRGLWWALDDTRISPAEWPPLAEGAALDASGAPPRMESASAYLLLYRQCRPGPKEQVGGAKALPEELGAFVAKANADFAAERKAHAVKSSAAGAFVGQRRKAVDALVAALRREAQGRAQQEVAPEGFSVVPTAWLDALLRGTDRAPEDVEGGKTRLAPVLYGRTLMKAPEDHPGEQILDPLAVWCGEVKYVPTSALDDLKGLGGLDSSLFLGAVGALRSSACEAAWSVIKIFQQEWLTTAEIVFEGKVSAAEARVLQGEGRGAEAVWVSQKVQKLWQKMVTPPAGASKLQQDPHVAILRSFLREVKAARWAPPGDAAGDAHAEAPGVSEALNLTSGLVCGHGLVGAPRLGSLVRRELLERLLQLAGEKERAYRRLWPDAPAIPRLRTGVLAGGLLGSCDVCAECRDRPGCIPCVSAPALLLRVVVRRRYVPSGVVRAQGHLELPEGQALTGELLGRLLREQMDLPPARLLACAGGAEVEVPLDGAAQDALRDMAASADLALVVEKDETVREAVAFQGSIFRGGALS